MIRAFTQEQRKQINTILNVDDNLTDADDAIRIALSFVAQMCAPEVLESNVVFYITNDDDGNIKLEMEA